jgi:DNA-binding PadR family transcriptional regulator
VSLKHVILVVLNREPATGYQISELFAGAVGHIWNTSHQAVYRALSAMNAEGLVSFTEQVQSGKPDKKTYCISQTGEQALNTWLLSPQQPARLNEDMMVKFYAGTLCAPAELIAQVREHMAVHQQNIDSYEVVESQLLAGDKQRSADERIQFMTLRRGILMEKARLDWCREALQVLEGL